MDPFDKHLDDDGHVDHTGRLLDPHRTEPVQTDNRPRPEDGPEAHEHQHNGPRDDLMPEDEP